MGITGLKINREKCRNRKFNQTSQDGMWKKVKIKGKVISEGNKIGHAGLIGLEVLSSYDTALVKSNKMDSDRLLAANQRRKKTLRSLVKSNDCESIRLSLAKVENTQILKSGKLKIVKKNNKNTKCPKQTEMEQQEVDTSDEMSIDNLEYPPERFALIKAPDQLRDGLSYGIVGDLAAEDEALNIHDVEEWSGLGVPPEVLRAIAESGFNKPTKIQILTLPAGILGKKDVLGAAETGSGKTLAFGLPILAGILELKKNKKGGAIRKAAIFKEQSLPQNKKRIQNKKNKISINDQKKSLKAEEGNENEHFAGAPLYAVVLTPTRELAVQVKNHLIAVAKYTGIRIAAVFGGLSIEKQERLLKHCPEIVVATPGRLWELYQQENPHISKIGDISFLVIDETDRMVEKGHFEELGSLLKIMNSDEEKKQSRQNFVFSATLTLVHDLPNHMKKRNLDKRSKIYKQTPGMKLQKLIEEIGISQPKIVDITRSQQTAQTLSESRLICSVDRKDYYLYYFIARYPGRTIVFCNSIDCVKRLTTIFGLLQCNPLPLHANMIQKQRLKNLERFRDNFKSLLIATDVAARGLDIPDVDHVIHYQVPRTSENYVHRSGRTARSNKTGITVMFMEPGEVGRYINLHKTLDRSEDMPLFPVSEHYLNAIKERVQLAREVDKLELKLRRNQSEFGWMKKHANDMEIIVDGFNEEFTGDQDEDLFIIERRRDRLHLENSRVKLNHLLAKPIFPERFSFKYPNSTLGGQPSTLEADNSCAVKVLKKSVEDIKTTKKLRNKKKIG